MRTRLGIAGLMLVLGVVGSTPVWAGRPEAPAATRPNCRRGFGVFGRLKIPAPTVPATKPNPKSLRLPPALIVDGKRIEVRSPADLEAWWNEGPFPKDLPGMNAAHLARRVRRLRSFTQDAELANQILAWEPFAHEWEQAYLYQVATNPPPSGVEEYAAKGYTRIGSGEAARFVREGGPTRPPKGNFTAPERAALMRAVLEKAQELRRELEPTSPPA